MTEVTWWDIACTDCGAPARQMCFTRAGKTLGRPHAERVEEALKAQSQLRLRTGVCPVCVSEEDLDADGRIGPHKQIRGITRTDIDCAGAGQLPDGED